MSNVNLSLASSVCSCTSTHVTTTIVSKINCSSKDRNNTMPNIRENRYMIKSIYLEA